MSLGYDYAAREPMNFGLYEGWPQIRIAGSDCGFGTFAVIGAVDPDIAYSKLASLANGVGLASIRNNS